MIQHLRPGREGEGRSGVGAAFIRVCFTFCRASHTTFLRERASFALQVLSVEQMLSGTE